MLKYGFIIFIIWYILFRKTKIPKEVNYLFGALCLVYAAAVLNMIIKFLE